MIKTPVAALLIATSLGFGALALPRSAAAELEFSVTIAPPPIPVYEQPPIPAPDYIWVPGYWYYGPYGYYWVPGTWVEPPTVGLLWTPGYWGWSQGFFVWSPGYWAPQVGFYGGVAYGFGYSGHGYEGGYWRGNRFYYNREVTNITNVQITNVYSKTVVNNVTVNRVSYVGGPGGLTARPTTEEERVMHEHHISATPAQVEHRSAAGARPELVASVNHGKPAIAATSKPNDFQAHVTGASRAGGPVPVHVRELPAAPSPSKPGANPQAEYQRQQSDLQARHQQERDALAQMQERDHAYLTQQHANANAQAQAQAQAALEHQHRQQTEFLQQRQASEMQAVRPPSAHQPPPPHGEPTRH